MKSTSHDHSEQLKAALNVTRQEIIDQIAATDGERKTFLMATAAAADDQCHGITEWHRTEDAQKVFAAIREKADQGRLNAGAAATYAADSSTAAEATKSAMTVAAAAINDADAAVETLDQIVRGIASLARSNDKDTPLDKAGKKAVEKLSLAMESVNMLKSQSVDASILAAQPLAGAVTEAFGLVKTKIDALNADAAAALTRANELAAKAVGEHHAKAESFWTPKTQIGRAMAKKAALEQALFALGHATEGNVIVNPTSSQALLAMWEPTGEDGAPNETRKWDHEHGESKDWLRYIAVEKSQLPQFKFPDSVQAVEKMSSKRYHHESGKPEEAVHDEIKNFKLRYKHKTNEHANVAYIKSDHEGKAIKFENSYVVFAVRKYKDPDRGITDRVVCSLPSAPVVARWAYDATYKPKVIQLPADAFLVVLPGEMIQERRKHNQGKVSWDNDSLEFRVFIVPSEMLDQIAPDDQWDKRYLAEQATPANYVTLLPGTELKELKDTTEAVKKVKELNSDDRKKRNLPVESSHPANLTEQSIVAHSIMAYYGPYALAPEMPDKSRVTIGEYRDSFGDPIDLARSSYKVAVLIVVKKLEGHDAGDPRGLEAPEMPETIASAWETIHSTGPNREARNPAKK
jgi:hypothetical protein